VLPPPFARSRKTSLSQGSRHSGSSNGTWYSDDQGALGPGDRGAERLGGAPIRLGGSRVVREVVNEGCVNPAVRSIRSTPQALEVLKRTAMHLGPCSASGRRQGLRNDLLGGLSRVRETTSVAAVVPRRSTE